MDLFFVIVYLATIAHAQHSEEVTTAPQHRKFHRHQNDRKSATKEMLFPTSSENFQVEMIRPRSSRPKSQDYHLGQMLFPGEFQRQTTAKAPEKNNPNCSYGFCENVNDYPHDIVKSLLDKSPDLKNLLKTQLINETAINLANRGQFDTSDDNTFCATRSHLHFPETAYNLDNLKRTVVNINDTRQGIIYETCADEGKACRYSEVFPKEMYATTCVQKYSVRTLAVVNDALTTLTWDSFKFPSCCLCHIEKLE